MPYAPGERERELLFYEQRRNRLAQRQRIMAALSGDPGAYRALWDNYEALVTSWLNPDLSLHHDREPEEDFPETCPPTNQNVW